MERRIARCDASGWSCCLAPARGDPPQRGWAGLRGSRSWWGLEDAQPGGPDDADRADPIPEGVGAAEADRADPVAEIIGPDDAGLGDAVAEGVDAGDLLLGDGAGRGGREAGEAEREGGERGLGEHGGSPLVRGYGVAVHRGLL